MCNTIEWIRKVFENKPQSVQSAVCRHLKRRYSETGETNKLNIVFDLLHRCNLQCLGCGTNAHINKEVNDEIPIESVRLILDKIDLYAKRHSLPVSIVYGGGEPFLHKNICEIIKYTSDKFGSENVGVDTNGALPQSYEMLEKAMPYLGYIGVSSNTFQDVYLRYAYKNLLNICDNYEHVVLWGQGRKLVALFEIYQKKLDCSIYYVDNSPSKKGKDFFGLMIHSPKEMLDYSADFVILAVGDKNMNVIKSKVKYILEKQGRQFVRIVTLGEIMNPNFEV